MLRYRDFSLSVPLVASHYSAGPHAQRPLRIKGRTFTGRQRNRLDPLSALFLLCARTRAPRLISDGRVSAYTRDVRQAEYLSPEPRPQGTPALTRRVIDVAAFTGTRVQRHSAPEE